jgi:hypothetical protein
MIVFIEAVAEICYRLTTILGVYYGVVGAIWCLVNRRAIGDRLKRTLQERGVR